MSGNRENKAFLYYILTASLLCSGLLYLVIKYNVGIRKSPMKLSSLSRDRCYRSDGNSFIRDQLNKFYLEKASNISGYRNESDAFKLVDISNNYSTITEFIQNTREAFLSRRLISSSISIYTIFHDPLYKDLIRPSCDGLWMEFGVFRGATLSHMANWKRKFCGNTSEPVYGFDTFTGLPTDWRPGIGRGTFSIPNGTHISVPLNVQLIQGLFIDTLPIHLRLIDRQSRCHTPVSFVHIDCDIYDGARDVLFLLGNRFVSGTVLVFDELFNYPTFEKHEIKALYEFSSASNLRLIPLGTGGNIELQPSRDVFPQSFAFLIDTDKSNDNIP